MSPGAYRQLPDRPAFTTAFASWSDLAWRRPVHLTGTKEPGPGRQPLRNLGVSLLRSLRTKVASRVRL